MALIRSLTGQCHSFLVGASLAAPATRTPTYGTTNDRVGPTGTVLQDPYVNQRL